MAEEEEEEQQLLHGEPGTVVWAKLAGFALWPARVRSFPPPLAAAAAALLSS
jgi:hypothetical protein